LGLLGLLPSSVQYSKYFLLDALTAFSCFSTLPSVGCAWLRLAPWWTACSQARLHGLWVLEFSSQQEPFFIRSITAEGFTSHGTFL